ncbi:MAG TPA: response regulator transcription factor [Aridibacter sp.]|nr:response regulator transcription factor [Aridibacter sp.]
MKRTILIFGLLAGTVLILFELSRLSLWRRESTSEVFIIISGLSFIAVGFLLSRFLAREEKRTKSGNLNDSDLTKQEHRVLTLVAEGMSNSEIAEELFITESTVKTHVSNVLLKLNARRRTEAVKIGRDLEII